MPGQCEGVPSGREMGSGLEVRRSIPCTPVFLPSPPHTPGCNLPAFLAGFSLVCASRTLLTAVPVDHGPHGLGLSAWACAWERPRVRPCCGRVHLPGPPCERGAPPLTDAAPDPGSHSRSGGPTGTSGPPSTRWLLWAGRWRGANCIQGEKPVWGLGRRCMLGGGPPKVCQAVALLLCPRRVSPVPSEGAEKRPCHQRAGRGGEDSG